MTRSIFSQTFSLHFPKMRRSITIASLFLLISHFSYAQLITEPIVTSKDGYQLKFTNNSPDFSTALRAKMIATFFQVYPQLVNTFNKKAAKEVTFNIDTAFKGVAGAGGGQVVFNPDWFKKHPGDIDVVTHEVMHIVQDYGNTNGPGWLTEGIADYVRFKFGVDNQGANWSLPVFKPTQHYDNAYRITARFLNWMEVNGNQGIVVKLDSAMRSNTYKESIWKELSGKTIDELWASYAANPG